MYIIKLLAIKYFSSIVSKTGLVRKRRDMSHLLVATVATVRETCRVDSHKHDTRENNNQVQVDRMMDGLKSMDANTEEMWVDAMAVMV